MRKWVCSLLLCFFSCLASMGIATAEERIVFLDLADAVNPVSRRSDLLCTLNGFVGSDNWRRKAYFNADGAYTVEVDSEDGADGWSVFRVGWDVSVLPDAVEFELKPSRASRLAVELYTNYHQSVGGFFMTQTMPEGSVIDFPSDEYQSVQFRWQDFKLTEAQRQEINGIGFFFYAPLPYSLAFRKITFLFDNPEKAAAFRKAYLERFGELQRPMIEALRYRKLGTQRILQENDALLREKLIWQGIELLAQQVQIDYFNKLYQQVNPPQQQLDFEEENLRLRTLFADASQKFEPDSVAALQQRVEAWIEQALATIPPEKRRWKIGADTRFYAPTGEAYRFFGPFFFRGMFDQNSVESWRKADMRYLAALGFNGIRLFVGYSELEPRQGELNEHCVEREKAILAEAERYGIGASMDLHWPYPAWFCAGQPGVSGKPAYRSAENSYHWSEALTATYRLIGAAFADVPNLIAFEIPTNETPIASDPQGLTAFPELMKEWNEFLRREYGSREALNAVWGAAAQHGDRYRLQENENWDDHTILPMGFQQDASVEEAYENNPRLYDFLRFVAAKQTQVTGEIAAALRMSIPDAVCVFQRTIGDMWDCSAVPLNYRAILTSVAPSVLPGTHYDMGSIQAEKAAAFALASFDSEQQMEDNFPAVQAHVEIGGGFSPFAFHAVGGGGMMFSDNDWHLKQSVLHLIEHGDWIKQSWPKQNPDAPEIAVVTSARREATTGIAVASLLEMLKTQGIRVRLLESLRVLAEPDLLNGADGVMVASDEMDVKMLALLNAADKPTLYFGALSKDAYARNMRDGLPGALVQQGLFLRDFELKNVDASSGSIDLSGYWDWKFITADTSVPMTPPVGNEVDWEQKSVPGKWGEKGLTGSMIYYLGDAWQRVRFHLPEAYREWNLHLKMGAVDDLDCAWINGVLIGATDEHTPNYWMAERNYPIPREALRYGGENELVVRVRNLRDDGGIYRAPVEIAGNQNLAVNFADGSAAPAALSEHAPLLHAEQLRDEVEVLGTVALPGAASDTISVFLKQGQNFWWVSERFSSESAASEKVIHTFLQEISLNQSK